ncbi:hypothetical protein D3C78_1857360 [compost metagenome]
MYDIACIPKRVKIALIKIPVRASRRSNQIGSDACRRVNSIIRFHNLIRKSPEASV